MIRDDDQGHRYEAASGLPVQERLERRYRKDFLVALSSAGRRDGGGFTDRHETSAERLGALPLTPRRIGAILDATRKQAGEISQGDDGEVQTGSPSWRACLVRASRSPVARQGERRGSVFLERGLRYSGRRL